jgi:hypothetical protein
VRKQVHGDKQGDLPVAFVTYEVTVRHRLTAATARKLQRYVIVEGDAGEPDPALESDAAAFVRRAMTFADELLRSKKTEEPKPPA